MEPEYPHILLFDGVCNLCNRLVKFVISRDSGDKFRFASLQSDTGKRLLEEHHITGEVPDTFVYIRKGRILLRSAGALQVLRDIGGGWKYLYGLMIIPPFIRDWVYRRIARSRYRVFGRQETCLVPGTGIRERFLEGGY